MLVSNGKRRLRIFAGTAIAGTLLALGFCWHTTETPKAAVVAAEPAPSEGSAEVRSWPVQDPAPTENVVTAYPELADGPEEPPMPGTETLIDIPRYRRRIETRRPQLIEYKKLTDKVIRTAAENERLKQLLADPRMAAAARDDLKAVKEDKFDEIRQVQRTYQIDFLRTALEWDDNPARGDAMRAVRESILEKNLDSSRPERLRKSLAGDKIELFQALYETSPAEASAFREQVKNTPLDRLTGIGEGLSKLARAEGRKAPAQKSAEQ